MTLNWYLLVPAALTALGVGLLVRWLLATGHQLYQAVTRKNLFRPLASESQPVSIEELYGIPPLLPWYVLSALLGWFLGQVLLSGPLRRLGLLLALLPLYWKKQQIKAGQQQVQRELGALVDDLRLYLSLAPTAGAALRLVIDDAPPGILWEQLRQARDTVMVAGAEEALQNVAAVLSAPALSRLVARVKAARAGSTALRSVLQAATAELVLDLHREIEEQVEAAPTRLLVPLLIMLMLPLLILVLTPPVQMLLTTLTGVGSTPLGR